MGDPTSRDVLVVGAGLAGTQTVAALRDAGFDGRIRVLGAEGIPPYDRPPLSKHLFDRPTPAWLADEIGVDLAALADEVRLDLPARSLVLTGGRPAVGTDDGVFVADDLVLATGARAVRVPGWEAALTLHTAADADRLRAALRPGARLVVIGAGWIGAEVAGVAAAAGHRVTVVEAAAAPLSAALGGCVGGLLGFWYDEAQVELLTGALVARVDADGVALADGRHLPADVVLAAVGARPATAWLDGALPLLPDGSVRVDAAYRVLAGTVPPRPPGAPGESRAASPGPGGGSGERTMAVPGPGSGSGEWTAAAPGPGDGPGQSTAAVPGPGDGRVVPGVWAVGDVARRWSPRHGWVPGGHWDGALRGPRALVGHLLGRPPEPPDDDPAPYVFSTQLGHDLALFGEPAGDDVVLRGDPASGGWAALWFTPGETLTAVLVVDRPRDVGAARRLFAAATLPRVDRATAADPSQPLRPLL